MKVLAVLFAFFCIVNCSSFNLDKDYLKQYEGYSVYLVEAKTRNQLTELERLSRQYGDLYNFWIPAQSIGRPINIMTKNEDKQDLEAFLKRHEIKYEIVIEDVAQAIKSHHDFSSKNDVKDFNYGKYHTLDEIYAWIDEISKIYSDYVSVFNVTRSYEKRYLKALKISIPSSTKKPAIWLDGGIHAREWISSATVVYITYSLLSQYGKDGDVTKILNTFDFYILPVFNVDGYNYTWTTDRMWRKTRSKTSNPKCFGVDPNRNWDSDFCGQGASHDPCDDTYCGPNPFSEIEVAGVADFILKSNGSIISYVNFHSYSQIWMTPYGYTTKKPKDFTIQDNGSIQAIDALSKIYGTQYTHGNVGEIIYVASGGSIDWTYDTAKILYSYGVELRDQGKYGFLLPENQIIPSGIETFAAIKALSFYIKSKL